MADNKSDKTKRGQELITSASHPPKGGAGVLVDSSFEHRPDGIYWFPPSSGCIKITNFMAQILRSLVVHDAKGGISREYVIEVTIARVKTKIAPVKSDKFEGMKWLDTAFGVDVYWDEKHRKQVIQAIKEVSLGHPEIHEFQSLGYREVEDRWVYIHKTGAITGSGPSEKYSLYEYLKQGLSDWADYADLDKEQREERIKECVHRSLQLLLVDQNGPIGHLLLMSVAYSLLSHIMPIEFGLVLQGIQGNLKDRLAALPRSFFNKGITAPTMRWSDRSDKTISILQENNNSVQVISGLTCPVQNKAPYFKKVKDVLDSARNGTPYGYKPGIGSANPNTNVFVISTSDTLLSRVPEDISEQLIYVQVMADKIDMDCLAKLEGYAKDGDFTIAAAAFTHFVLKRKNPIKVNQTIEETRIKAAEEVKELNLNGYGSPKFISLLVAFKVYLDFCVKVDAIEESKTEKLYDIASKRLGKLLSVSQDYASASKTLKLIITQAMVDALYYEKVYVLDYSREGYAFQLEKDDDNRAEIVSAKAAYFEKQTKGDKEGPELLGWYDKEENVLYVDKDFDIEYILDRIAEPALKKDLSKGNFWTRMRHEHVTALNEKGKNSVRRSKCKSRNPNGTCYLINMVLETELQIYLDEHQPMV